MQSGKTCGSKDCEALEELTERNCVVLIEVLKNCVYKHVRKHLGKDNFMWFSTRGRVSISKPTVL